MDLQRHGGVDAAADAAGFVYKCTMDDGVLDAPGDCPECGMLLDDRYRVPRASLVDEHWIYRCSMDGGERETPGPCPKCGMMLDSRHRVQRPGHHHAERPESPESERTIWVCPMHPEAVFDAPGVCVKEGCGGMALEAKKILPGSKLVWVCPDHDEVRKEVPGTCHRTACGKALHYRIVSEARRLADAWSCSVHPEDSAGGKSTCSTCGMEMKHYEYEQLLALPATAVIDTGVRKVVYVDRGAGIFDAIEVVVGHRAGEYFPVLSGLAAGDRVVTAGAFLLDAEARLNPAAGSVYFGAAGGPGK